MFAGRRLQRPGEPLQWFRHQRPAPGEQIELEPSLRGRTAVREHLMQAVKGLLMEKWFCWGAMAVGGILLVLFLLNTLLGIPFGKAINLGIDIVVILASGLLIYLGWNALRDIS
jgi:hypothetical protein